MATTKRRPRITLGGILTECNHLGGLPIDLKTYEENELLREGPIAASCYHRLRGDLLDSLR